MSLPDPKARLGAFLRDGEQRHAGRILIPWLPASKKNDYRAIVKYRVPKAKAQPYAIVVPGDATRRQERAIALLWDATRAFDEGVIDAKTFDRVRSIAKRGAFTGNGVGPKKIEDTRAKAKLRERPPLFAGQIVKMNIEVIMGDSPGEDRVDVRILELGPRPERRRTGLKRDTINIPALIADALNKLAYDDDADVVEMSVRLTYAT